MRRGCDSSVTKGARQERRPPRRRRASGRSSRVWIGQLPELRQRAQRRKVVVCLRGVAIAAVEVDRATQMRQRHLNVTGERLEAGEVVEERRLVGEALERGVQDPDAAAV